MRLLVARAPARSRHPHGQRRLAGARGRRRERRSRLQEPHGGARRPAHRARHRRRRPPHRDRPGRPALLRHQAGGPPLRAREGPEQRGAALLLGDRTVPGRSALAREGEAGARRFAAHGIRARRARRRQRGATPGTLVFRLRGARVPSASDRESRASRCPSSSAMRPTATRPTAGAASSRPRRSPPTAPSRSTSTAPTTRRAPSLRTPPAPCRRRGTSSRSPSRRERRRTGAGTTEGAAGARILRGGCCVSDCNRHPSPLLGLSHFPPLPVRESGIINH